MTTTLFKVTIFGINEKLICVPIIIAYLLSCTISNIWQISSLIFTSTGPASLSRTHWGWTPKFGMRKFDLANLETALYCVVKVYFYILNGLGMTSGTERRIYRHSNYVVQPNMVKQGLQLLTSVNMAAGMCDVMPIYHHCLHYVRHLISASHYLATRW